jgi:hypothetical protein
MLKAAFKKAFTKTLPAERKQVISRTDSNTGAKKAIFVNDPPKAKTGLPNERFWPGRADR